LRRPVAGFYSAVDNFGCGSSIWTLFRENDEREDRPMMNAGGQT